MELNRDDARAAIKSIINSVRESDFVRKVAETFATRVFLIGIGLVTSIIVTRILGPEGRGFYAVATAIGATGVQFGNLGLHASNTYCVARDRTLLPSLLGNTLIVSFVLGGGGAVFAWMLFVLLPDLAPVKGLLLFMALAWIPFGLAYLLLQNLLLGVHEVRAYNKVELINNILAVVLIALLIVSGFVTVETVFLTSLIVLVISIALILYPLRKHINRFPTASLTLFRENIPYGIKAYLAAFFSFLVLRADILMVKYILDAEQAGYYSLAVNMVDLVYMLPITAGTILFPKLSAMQNVDDKWSITKKVAGWMLLIMLFIALFTAILATPLIKILFGKQFIPAAPAFIWLLPGIVMLSLASIISGFIASITIPNAVVILYFAVFIFNVLLNFLLIPNFGIIGASMSSTICYILCFFGILSISRKVGR